MYFTFPTEANPTPTTHIPLVLTSAADTPRIMTSDEFGLKEEKASLDEYFGVVVTIA